MGWGRGWVGWDGVGVVCLHAAQLCRKLQFHVRRDAERELLRAYEPLRQLGEVRLKCGPAHAILTSHDALESVFVEVEELPR